MFCVQSGSSAIFCLSAELLNIRGIWNFHRNNVFDSKHSIKTNFEAFPSRRTLKIFYSLFFAKRESISIGSGKTIVEFFSEEMEFNV